MSRAILLADSPTVDTARIMPAKRGPFAGCIFRALRERTLPAMLTAGGSPVTFWEFLNNWWNLPYLVMLGLVGVFFALQAVGMLAHEHDVEGGTDSDADGGTDSDADSGSDSPADGDDGDSEGNAGSGHAHGAAAFLGIGRVP